MGISGGVAEALFCPETGLIAAVEFVTPASVSMGGGCLNIEVIRT